MIETYREEFEWKNSKMMFCLDCPFKTKDRGTMLFHLVVGHQKIEELLKPHIRQASDEVRKMNICDKCGKQCDRIEDKKDPDYAYLCCNCSGSYIDSLCEECESNKTLR